MLSRWLSRRKSKKWAPPSVMPDGGVGRASSLFEWTEPLSTTPVSSPFLPPTKLNGNHASLGPSELLDLYGYENVSHPIGLPSPPHGETLHCSQFVYPNFPPTSRTPSSHSSLGDDLTCLPAVSPPSLEVDVPLHGGSTDDYSDSHQIHPPQSQLLLSPQDEDQTSNMTTTIEPTARNVAPDDFSSMSTIFSDYEDAASPPEAVDSAIAQSQEKLERQNKRRFLMRGSRFNLLIVGESKSGKTTLRNKMFESWHLVGRGHSMCGTEHTYQLAPTITFFQVSVVEAFCTDFVVTACQLKLFEYLNRKKHRTPGRDERMHACIYLVPPSCDYLSIKQASLLRQLSYVVNLVPVLSMCDLNPSSDDLERRRDSFHAQFSQYNIQVFDDWLYPPSENHDSQHIDYCSPDDFSGNNRPTTTDTMRKAMRSPLLVDAVSSQDQLGFSPPAVDGRARMSPAILRATLVEDSAFLLIDKTKNHFYGTFYEEFEERIRIRAHRQHHWQMGVVSSLVVGIGALVVSLASHR